MNRLKNLHSGHVSFFYKKIFFHIFHLNFIKTCKELVILCVQYVIQISEILWSSHISFFLKIYFVAHFAVKLVRFYSSWALKSTSFCLPSQTWRKFSFCNSKERAKGIWLLVNCWLSVLIGKFFLPQLLADYLEYFLQYFVLYLK